MKRYILFMLLIIIPAGFLWAQEEVEFTPGVQPEVAVARVTVPGTITFSFKDADIRSVMRLIAKKAGVNIVYGPDVTGKVNMELRDVPWEHALYLVLDLNGYAYQKEKNVIKVLRKEDIVKEPLSTEVFTLNYSTAADVKGAVEQILSVRGKIKTDARSNTIIVTDIPANINKIEIVLARLDSRTPQVLIETRIIEIRGELEEDLGIKWTSLKGYKLRFGSAKRTYDSKRWGGEVTCDEKPGRTDTYTTEEKDWEKRDRIYIPEGTVSDTTTINLVDNISRTLTQTFTRGLLKSDIRTAILSAADFEVVLSLLVEETDVNLLSNPRVVTANNETAEIEVISEYPVPNYEFDTETSQWSITGFNKEKIGVTFIVTPNISTDGYITMKVEPEVSKLIDLVPFTAGGATVYIPYVGRKRASTKLIIKSGDTLAVGGLIDEDKVNVITKIPILGDIPVLGRLFSHKDVDNVKKNIIFFITATIIDEETKGLITETQPVAYERAKVDYSEVFHSKPELGSDLSGGNKGYITNKPETSNQ